MEERAVALVVAAGRGERLGADRPKALVECCGRPLLAWSLDALAASPQIAATVVALPPDLLPDADLLGGARPVAGGAHRSLSVRAALAAAPAGPELVLVHDAARPLLTAELIAACLSACASDGVDGAVAAAPVTDTIKVAGDGVVSATLDRSRLWAAQTPQVFRRDVLAAALEQDDAVLAAATDDASLVEAHGGTVVIVPAPAENLKVTTPADLQRAASLLAARSR